MPWIGLTVAHSIHDEVVVYNHNRTPEEHQVYNLVRCQATPADAECSIWQLEEAYRRATYQEGLLLDQLVAPTPQRQASIELICQRTLDRIERTHARAVLHSPVWNEYRLSIGSWTPDQASLEFTILDELEHWVLCDDGYDGYDELPSLVNIEQESSAGNPSSPEPLDIFSFLARIWDNASALYDITNHHPTLTPISEQAHIQVLIEQGQQVVNTLHNLQRLVSPPLPPIPVSHDPEEHHGSSYFAARICKQAENLRNVQSLLDPDFAEHCQRLHLLIGARELYESHRRIIRNGYESPDASSDFDHSATLRNFHLD
ncbi:hypothetical protein DICSQDRAFT_173817 [Dichomitus squalens LYAD-421 SS1]|uniref:Uncharacterized protein n=1 Tax=Dichomitus squalens (strain LYAD-421) TaxID=732165 RepID=R7SN96_DICSQ|nr:uncharacterized protein DICSQDRAFT_173817 [Dichomitus squalens LYAD-421 SS1]EJF57591.1 hypothetical protein DICSQDRAFT_173817 [Dichomitus squalens LYAD-421 SS1]